jgi:flagellar motility protein MotE (MotC chaperone)
MKLSTFLFSVLVVALSSEAHAQTTSCGVEFGRWVCHTAQPPAGGNIVANAARAQREAYDQAERERADREAAPNSAAAEQAQIDAKRHEIAQAAYDSGAAEQAQIDAQRHELAKAQARYLKTLTGLIRKGECEEAKNYALENSDLDGAEKVVRICTAH